MPPTPPPQRTRATSAQPKKQKIGGGGSKQQQRQHVLPPTVSPAVTALQKLISHIEKPPPKSASGGSCFCQSRTHPLSPYTPQCMSCGLVLCSLNPPFHPCPFADCSAPLLADHAKRALVDQLSAQVAQTIADEEDTRRREDEARVRAAGAVPDLGAAGGNNNNSNTLSSAGTSTSTSRQQPRVAAAAAVSATAKASSYTTQTREPQQQQFHKVISLSGKGKVTATYTRISPSPSSASLHTKAEEEVIRVPPPLEGPEYVKLDPADFNSKKRLYENLRGEGPVYIPLPSEEKARSDAREGSGKRRRPQNNKSKKKQGKENLPQRPEAGPSSHA